MDLRLAFLANNCEEMPDGRFFVFGGGINVLMLPTIPCQVPFIAIFCRVNAAEEELRTEHTIRLVLVRPDGSKHDLGSAPVKDVKLDAYFAELGINFDLNVGLVNFPVQHPGIYRVVVSVDDDPIGELKFGIQVRTEGN
jgi:hypothetical protein